MSSIKSLSLLAVAAVLGLQGCASERSEVALDQASASFQAVKDDSNVLRSAPRDVIRAGRTVQATLSPSSVSGQSVTVNLGANPAQAAGDTVSRSEKRNGYMETVTALVRLMFNGEAPDGVRRTGRAAQPTRVGPYELRIVETYEVAGLRGQVMAIKNASEATVPVVVDSFLVAGVMAAATDRPELLPGGEARIFLVEEVR